VLTEYLTENNTTVTSTVSNKRLQPSRGRPLWGRLCSWVCACQIINYHTILIT